jgi:O-antigen biosynthesis protein
LLDEAYSRQAPEGFRTVSVGAIDAPDDIPIRLNHPDIGIRVTLEPTGKLAPGWYHFELCFPPEGVVDLLVNISFERPGEFWLRPAAVDRNHFAADLRVTDKVARITLLVGGSGRVRRPLRFSIMRSNRVAWLISIARRAKYVLKRDRFYFLRSAAIALLALVRPGTLAPSSAPASRVGEAPYDTWIRLFDENPTRDRGRHQERMVTLVGRPQFSCLCCIDEIDQQEIKRLGHQFLEQIYPHWQLVVAAPAPLLPAIQAELQACGVDSRFATFVPAAGDVASTLNALVEAASGEFAVKIPPRAILRPHALLELALVLDRYPHADLIYADEDVIDVKGRRSGPKFKPAWSPEYLVGTDYIGDPTVLRRQVLQKVGGWRPGLNGAGDHDMKLRIAEQVTARTIVHLTKILVHLPLTCEAVLSAASETKVLDDLIGRRRCRALVKHTASGLPRLQYLPDEPPGLVSLIIPTRDRAQLLELCVRTLLQRTSYRPLEIIVVDNDSKEAATHRLFERLQQRPEVRILHSPGAFNFSALNNLAAREARGKLLGLVNNDIEIIEKDWLGEMVGLAERPEVGCVGAKLLYPDGRLQHAGVITGLGGVADHANRFLPRNAPGYMNRMYFTHDVGAVTAACLVIRKSVYFEVGGFDERELKVAFNDVDFCLKVRRAGYRNVWSPFAELFHHESASRGFDYSPAKAKRFAAEVEIVRERWGQRLLSDPYYSPNLTHDLQDFSVRLR